MKRSKLTERQRKTLSKTKNKARRARLVYNYQYDANKRAARELGLIQDPTKTIELKKPKDMPKSKFERLVTKFQFPIVRSYLIMKK